MEIDKAIKILKEHNKWRSGAIEEIPMVNRKELTQAIDFVIAFVEKTKALQLEQSVVAPNFLRIALHKGLQENLKNELINAFDNQETTVLQSIKKHIDEINYKTKENLSYYSDPFCEPILYLLNNGEDIGRLYWSKKKIIFSCANILCIRKKKQFKRDKTKSTYRLI
jgi:hypothetical protein